MTMEHTPKEVFEAIKLGDIGLIKDMLANNEALLHLVTPLGTWLHIATANGQNEIAKRLVEFGIGVNVQGGPSNATPLKTAAYRGNTALLNYFLEHKAVMDTSEPERNPLFAAIHAGHINIAERLLAAGIDTKVSYTGATMRDMDAIAFAHEWGRTEIAEIITAHNERG